MIFNALLLYSINNDSHRAAIAAIRVSKPFESTNYRNVHDKKTFLKKFFKKMA